MSPKIPNLSPVVINSLSPQPKLALSDNPRQKRVAPGVDKQSTPPEFKRLRASYACLQCRSRKVRCNVSDGSPCLNCRLDHLQCVVKEHRSRKWKKKKAMPQCTDIEAMESISPCGNDQAACECSPTGRHQDNPSTKKQGPITSPGITCTDNTCLLDISVDSDVPCLSYKWPDYPCLQYLSHIENGVIKKFLRALEIQDTIAQLPPFVRPLPTNMEPDAIQYLHRMQALDLPPVSLQDSLLRAYVEYVYPSMPLMDLQNFLNTVHYRHGRNGQVSLFLYQSVMFAATVFVDMKALCQAGYKTRKEARGKFFQKARLLYDFDYEHEGLVLVQSLLHMTYWDESPGDLKGTWHWMSLAVSYCYRNELHRRPKCGITITSILEQRLRKRVWWCCFMRDRIIALGMRQPPMIEDGSFDVPMLIESDYEIEELVYSNTISQLDLAVLHDVKMQRELAMICIETARLCIPIGQMLKARYSIPSTSQSRNYQNEKTLGSALQTWAASLPHGWFDQLTMLDAQDGGSTILLQRAILHMLYHTAIWVLNLSKHSLPLGHQELIPSFGGHEIASFSWRVARDAASKISQMITNLHHLQLDRFLTSTAITSMIPAIIMHLAEMQNKSTEAGVTTARKLRQCIRVIEQLRDIYTGADSVASFIDAILTRTTGGINLTCEQHVISILKKELAAAAIAQEADSMNLLPYKETAEIQASQKSALYISRIGLDGSTPELLTASPLLHEYPPAEQITAPGDILNGSIGKDIETAGLNCINDYVDLDWKATEEINFDGEFWLDANECK